MRVALVYDRVNKWGGAERVIIALRKIFPDSVLYTSVYEKQRACWAKKIPVIPSFLQKIPFASKFHEAFAIFMPIAFESFNFDQFDLVISVTSEAAKGIITKPSTRHISIILTPTRYLWSGYEDYFPNLLFKVLGAPFVLYLRAWDKIASRRPDRLVAISENVRKRIKKYYGLDSEIIYPPLMMRPTVLSSRLGVHSSKRTPRKSYFLVVSRLVQYKRIDLAIKAANRLRINLKIIGRGSEYQRLRDLAGGTIEFLGYVTDQELKKYYASCQALIFPGIEDFGLVMVEAQSFGKPVLAYRGGGAQEIIIERKTGVFFDRQTPAELARVLKSFRPSRYNTRDCKRNAERFSLREFEQKIKALVTSR